MNYKTLALAIALLAFVFIGCSKDEDGGSSKDVVKVTVSTSESFNTVNGSSVSASISSTDRGGEFLPVKINGETFSSKIAHQKRDSDFSGGQTYVFESVGDYQQVLVNIAGYSIQSTFTLTYKIEQGSKIIASEVVNFTPESDAYMEQYIVK